MKMWKRLIGSGRVHARKYFVTYDFDEKDTEWGIFARMINAECDSVKVLRQE